MSIQVISKVELTKDVEVPKRVETDYVVRTYSGLNLGDEEANYFPTYEEALKFYNEVCNKVPTELMLFTEIFYADNDSEIESITFAKNYEVVETKDWR